MIGLKRVPIALATTLIALTFAGGTKEPASVACGAITGSPAGNTLAIAVHPVGAGKDAGVAWLRRDGTKTRVMILFANGIVPSTQHPANAKSAPATSPTSYQAGVYRGNCATTSAKAAYPLGIFGKTPTTAATPAAGSSTTAATRNAIDMRTATIPAKLQDLLKTPHVIAIQPAQSASSPTKPLACGAIGGDMSGTDLAFVLRSVNSSPDVAFAWLQENGNKTDVTLFLVATVTA